MKVRFITGLFSTVPAIATAWLLWVFWNAIDDFFSPVYTQILGRRIPGLGFLTAVVIIFIMGTIARNVVGRRILARIERLFEHVPIFRSIYPSVKQLLESFSPQQRNSFKSVVLAEHPRKGEYVFGFVTSELLLEGVEGKRAMVTVFVPTNNLYLGDVIVVREGGDAAHRPHRGGGHPHHPLRGHRHAAPAAARAALITAAGGNPASQPPIASPSG